MREHNLENVDADLPRNQLIVVTGISKSGKSSLAFGTIYAEAQRLYLDSISPYARRLFGQMPVPVVTSTEELRDADDSLIVIEHNPDVIHRAE